MTNEIDSLIHSIVGDTAPYVRPRVECAICGKILPRTRVNFICAHCHKVTGINLFRHSNIIIIQPRKNYREAACSIDIACKLYYNIYSEILKRLNSLPSMAFREIRHALLQRDIRNIRNLRYSYPKYGPIINRHLNKVINSWIRKFHGLES